MQFNDQSELILALQNPSIFRSESNHWRLIETHISWVILCGSYAYKIKKALNLGFLDYTSLAKRKFYCTEELRLNSRLAPALYLEVIAITGTTEQPQLGGPGEAIEYAVKMQRFPDRALLCDRAEDNSLEATHIDQIIAQVAEFHLSVPKATANTPFGDPDHVHAPALENFSQIQERIDDPQYLHWVKCLQEWTDQEYQRCYQTLARRKQDGFVRECHGDMHLGNIAVVDGVPLIFDGIEFNANLYWIDVMSEVAFLCMDLKHYGKQDYAFRFLSGYLELTGDYFGLDIFRYYLVYRVMVRAKVACIRIDQQHENKSKTRSLREFEHYIQLALAYTHPQQPLLLITHGLSGSGKSTLSALLAEHMGAIRIRSDRERQRLFGKGKREGDSVRIDDGIYSNDASSQTYARLEKLAANTLTAKYSVIVDATFLERGQREQFTQLANRLNVPIRILVFQAEPGVLRQRVAQRQRDQQDISEADLSVLESQLATYVGLDAEELGNAIIIDTEMPCSGYEMLVQIKQSMKVPPGQHKYERQITAE